ncbi:HetP family heterocyst commitment protein [Leptolyngbya sp. AN03gr2]|uniref:HetP family heterocyst commitment protein n=1 Tax=unclassified Leptolyngbya TaxID=2650499 RepID=UPI003D318204
MIIHRSSSSQPRNKVMSPEQFSQVVEAITEGRYSWACVLILRFAGYNPIHFIPHRTYSRLMKENRMFASESAQMVAARSRNSTQIKDLTYVEAIESHESSPHGGNLPLWFVRMMQEYDRFQIRL